MRYASFPPDFQSISPSFFTLFRTAFSENASTLSLKRKCISPETQARFPSNAEAFLHKHTRVFLYKHTYPCPRRQKTAQKRCFPTK